MTPCRIIVFGDLQRGKKQIHAAWDDWNPDPVMESRMARLKGAGSFYWPNQRDAWRRARVVVREPGVTQVKVETISGRFVGRLYQGGTVIARAD